MHSFSTVTSLVLAGLIWGCADGKPIQDRSMSYGSSTKSLMLADFNGDDPRVDTLSGEWRTVNDNIMGGRSLGGGEIREGVWFSADRQTPTAVDSVPSAPTTSSGI